jgi:hypothetical protein
VSRKPRPEWHRPQPGARHATEPVHESSGNVFADLNVPTPPELAPVFGGVVSPAPEIRPIPEHLHLGPVVELTPEVITTVKADEPIPAVEPAADADPVPHDENEPGRWVPPSVDYAVGRPEEWLGAPSISIRSALAYAVANPGPWPNAERLGRLQRHLEEVINALPDAIEACGTISDPQGVLKEDLETLRDIVA